LKKKNNEEKKNLGVRVKETRKHFQMKKKKKEKKNWKKLKMKKLRKICLKKKLIIKVLN
jgi:hypothetical protein